MIRLLVLMILCASKALAQGGYNDFEDPPHDYWKKPLNDPATKLHQRMEKKEINLPGGELAFLKAYLKALQVPEQTQTMVFSKTSLQRQMVNAHNPRAMYFSEDVYIGYIPGGRIEVTAIDPVLGGIFYIFDAPKAEGEVPVFERSRRCMGCHAGSFTGFLPGLMTNSVFANEEGKSIGTAQAHFSGHTAPLKDRWGGWFVTGAAQAFPHMGNQLAVAKTEAGVHSRPAGDLEVLFDPKKFLVGAKSDTVAILILDHQIGAVNRLMDANYKVRTEALSRQLPLDAAIWDASMIEFCRPIAATLCQYLLYTGEAPLPPGLKADPAFEADFKKRRQATPGGKSLKDLSLDGHLMKYRCSHMIDSNSFTGLPQAFRRLVFKSLYDILQASEPAAEYAHLSESERKEIIEILRATVPEFVTAITQ